MESVDQERLGQRELAADLKASVLARRELDTEMEDHLVEAFLARIEHQVESRVSSQLAEFRRGLPTKGKKGKSGPDSEVILGTIALAIPLMVVAAIFAGNLGVGLVMAGVVSVILLYFIDRWATN